MSSPEQAVDIVSARFGRHPGYRALHAKGIWCTGTFRATPQAAALTVAAHMQGEPVPVLARFSNAAGDPRVPDHAPDIRGFAVKFELPDGARTDLVAQTVPHFVSRTPDGFLELVRATTPGPAAAWRLPLFLARHPAALRSLPGDLATMRPLDSFATAAYYPLHAYGWRAAGGEVRHVRYRWIPAAGERRIGLREARRRGRDYLQDDVRERLSGDGTIRFSLELTLAGPGDPVDDASVRWPAGRETVDAGTLELTALDSASEQDGDVVVFDPTRVCEGIELTDDPVLRFRPRAYDVSVQRRSGRP